MNSADPAGPSVAGSGARGHRPHGAATAGPATSGMATDIPDKLVFRIGEVSRIVGVEPYVLRYWETEFPQLAPKKSGTGHRMYRRREVEQLLLIRQLLYERQYTIKGARQYLKELSHKRPGSVDGPAGAPVPAVPMPVSPVPVSPMPTAPMQVVQMPAAAAAGAWQPREQSRAAAAASAGIGGVTIDGLREELRSILALLE